MRALLEFKYLLDTNIVSDLVRNPQGDVFRQILKAGAGRVCTSILVACELRYGACKKGSAKLTEQLEAVLSALPVLPLESDVDRHYADIRTELEQRGIPIGANDLLIAAHARAKALTLITANNREFDRVPGLSTKSWLNSR